MTNELEEKIEEHGLKIRELEDEMSFKKWKFEELFDKIDKLTDAVQQIQLTQLESRNKLEQRVTQLETTNTTLKWVIGIGFSLLSIVAGYLAIILNMIK